ncbi:MAG: HepT-like ribonuclease domain-containing protein [Desulfobacterales bacterium]
MRDKLIHDYFGVDIDTVWLTVEKDITKLEEEVKRIIEKLG